MTPYRKEVIGDCDLYLGDCLEILPTLGQMGAVVTDPPFGIGFKYKTHKDSADDYGVMMERLMPLLGRVCEGPTFVWQSMVRCADWHRWFPEGWRIFAACKSFVQLRPVEVQHAWDPVIFWGARGGKHAGSIRDWHVATTPNFGAGRESIDHPCPRPLDQVQYIVDGLRVESILDPFMGSGTTGVACVKAGKKFTGIEIDEHYFQVACDRIRDTYKQPDFFVERPKPLTQEKML